MKVYLALGLILLAVLTMALVLAMSGPPGEAPPDKTPPVPEAPRDCLLTGIVLGEDSRPIPMADVQARILDPGLAFSAESAVSGPDGRFEIRLFPPRGRWEVQGVQPDGRVLVADRLVVARKGERPEVVLRPFPEPEPVKHDEPNLAGEVVDGEGRLLTGIPVIAVRKDGSIAARAASGPDGRFEMLAAGPLPLSVRIHDDPGSVVEYQHDRRIEVLPCLDLLLINVSQAPVCEALYVRVDVNSGPADEEVRVILLNSLGEVERNTGRRLAASPWRIEEIPHGPYDVVVQGAGMSGMLQGFDFTPGNDLAVVPLAGGAGISARLSRPARIFLLSLSPTLVPLSIESRDEDGIHGTVRGTWTRTRREDLAERVDFKGIPAGRYLLRILGPGLETIERKLELVADRNTDLGTLLVREATGSVAIRVFDRESPDREYGYLVRLYSGTGTVLQSDLEPGSSGDAVLSGLAEGAWRCRVDRKLGDPARLRCVGRDAVVVVRRGERTGVAVDCTWRFDF